MGDFSMLARYRLDSETIQMHAVTSFNGKMRLNSGLTLFVYVECINIQ